MENLPEIERPQTFRRPADYYSSPTDELAPLFPRWVPFGCGTASIVLIVLLVVGAAGVSSGAFSQLFEFVFASMQGELDKMMGPDVKPPQKAAFDQEMKKMRDAVRSNRLRLDTLQPLMREFRAATSDERVTAAEVDRLTREVHAVNAAVR